MVSENRWSHGPFRSSEFYGFIAATGLDQPCGLSGAINTLRLVLKLVMYRHGYTRSYVKLQPSFRSITHGDPASAAKTLPTTGRVQVFSCPVHWFADSDGGHSAAIFAYSGTFLPVDQHIQAAFFQAQ